MPDCSVCEVPEWGHCCRWRSRWSGLGEDALFEELCKGELRGGICERDIARDITVAGAMCMTEIFMQLEWNRAPKGLFDEAQLKKLRDRELRGSVSGGSNVW